MLTIKINDAHLEKVIAKRALSLGKTVHETAKDILLNALPDKNNSLQYPSLNPEENGYIMDCDCENDYIEEETIIPFSQVKDTKEYIENLRKNSWRRV